MLDMPVIGAKVPSKRRPPGGSPKPPDFPPPGIRLLPLKAKSRPAFPPPKACSKNKQGPQPPQSPPPERLLQKEQMKRKKQGPQPPQSPPPEQLLQKEQMKRKKQGPQPPQSPPPEQLLQKEQMKRKQRLQEQPWVERQLELEARRMELLRAKQLELEARRMELLRAKSKLEEDAKTKDTKLVEEAAGEMRNTRQDELPKQVEQQLLCPSCQAHGAPFCPPGANFCGRCGVSLMGVIIIDDDTSSSKEENEGSARAETDPYMQSKCLNKVRRPETDPYM